MKTSIATLMLFLGVDAITVPKKHELISIDITKTSYKNHKLVQLESAPQDPLFLTQYNEAINLVQNQDHYNLVQKNIEKKLMTMGNP